jgi:hypothetical protein
MNCTRLTFPTAITAAMLSLAAAPAFGAGYNVSITGPAGTTVGTPVVFQATGSNPADDFFSSWLDVSAIPTSAASSCPPGYFNGMQLAESTGGEQVVRALREEVDSGGNFSTPFGWTPSKPGSYLLCAYTNDGASGTLATASLPFDVKAGGGGTTTGGGGGGGGPTLAKPANTSKPKLKRSGRKLVCKPGSWTNQPDGYLYSWIVGGKTKSGANGKTLRVTRSLRGRRVKCRVTAANNAGTASATSRALKVR